MQSRPLKKLADKIKSMSSVLGCGISNSKTLYTYRPGGLRSWRFNKNFNSGSENSAACFQVLLPTDRSSFLSWNLFVVVLQMAQFHLHQRRYEVSMNLDHVSKWNNIMNIEHLGQHLCSVSCTCRRLFCRNSISAKDLLYLPQRQSFYRKALCLEISSCLGAC